MGWERDAKATCLGVEGGGGRREKKEAGGTDLVGIS